MLQPILQSTLLHGNLCAGVQVLHLAAAAGTRVQTEVRATRSRSQRALTPQRDERALLPLVLSPADLNLDFLTRQGTLDEDDLPFAVAGNALGFQVN
jgi:hypothetical protein